MRKISAFGIELAHRPVNILLPLFYREQYVFAKYISQFNAALCSPITQTGFRYLR